MLSKMVSNINVTYFCIKPNICIIAAYFNKQDVRGFSLEGKRQEGCVCVEGRTLKFFLAVYLAEEYFVLSMSIGSTTMKFRI